jgi:hypothetical protein
MRPSARRGLRTESETRNVRSKCRCSCVLQFTCRRAFSGVLHRPTCQVIHRSGLYFCSGVALPPGEGLASAVTSSQSMVWLCFRRFARRTSFKTWDLAARYRYLDFSGANPTPRGTARCPQRRETRGAPGALGSGTTGRDRSSGALTVMILPQVHLRKPCYDFYFL